MARKVVDVAKMKHRLAEMEDSLIDAAFNLTLIRDDNEEAITSQAKEIATLRKEYDKLKTFLVEGFDWKVRTLRDLCGLLPKKVMDIPNSLPPSIPAAIPPSSTTTTTTTSETNKKPMGKNELHQLKRLEALKKQDEDAKLQNGKTSISSSNNLPVSNGGSFPSYSSSSRAAPKPDVTAATPKAKPSTTNGFKTDDRQLKDIFKDMAKEFNYDGPPEEYHHELIRTLNSLHDRTAQYSTIVALSPDIYKSKGYKKLSLYLQRAQKDGIIELIDDNRRIPCARLLKKYHSTPTTSFDEVVPSNPKKKVTASPPRTSRYRQGSPSPPRSRRRRSESPDERRGSRSHYSARSRGRSPSPSSRHGRGRDPAPARRHPSTAELEAARQYYAPPLISTRNRSFSPPRGRKSTPRRYSPSRSNFSRPPSPPTRSRFPRPSSPPNHARSSLSSRSVSRPPSFPVSFHSVSRPSRDGKMNRSKSCNRQVPTTERIYKDHDRVEVRGFPKSISYE